MKRIPSLLLIVLSASAEGGVVTYEGDVFPEEVGWERVGSFDAQRWIDDGWFYERLELGTHGPPPIGETDFYRRSLADFAGEQAFFVEWRVQSGAPSWEIDPDISGNPGGLSVFGRGNALYHFTITDELVRVRAGFGAPRMFFDIEPDVAHTYRLELYGEESYAWFIDGELRLAGVPAGPFPRDDSNIIWGARYYLAQHTTRWDYIRYGAIPEPATSLLLVLGAMMVNRPRRGLR